MIKSFTYLFALLFLFSCSQSFDGIIIEGEVSNAEGKLILLEDVATPEKVILDSSRVANGQVSFDVYIKDHGVYRLREQESDEMIFVFLDHETKTIFIEWDILHSENYKVDGNRASNQLKTLMDYTQTISNEYLLIDSLAQSGAVDQERIEQMQTINRDRMFKFVEQFIDTVKSQDVAAFAFNYLGATPEYIPFLVQASEQLHKKDPDARYAKVWFETMDGYRKQQLEQVENGLHVGEYAPNFTTQTIDGYDFELNSLRGKYVLLDFWASWCLPCRKENPNIVAAYHAFNPRNFTVVSVSLDLKRDQWKKGITTDQLIWPYHVGDLQRWLSPIVKKYKVEAIPLSFVIDPNGKIIGKNLRGDALISFLEKTLPAEVKVDSAHVIE